MIKTNNTVLAAKINKLPMETQKLIVADYEYEKLNLTTGWVLWIFGFHYIHTGKYGLWFLYIFSNLIYIWWIRWLVQLVSLNQNIRDYNTDLLRDLYTRYR